MSYDRRTFYGIAEAWVAKSDGTPGPPFTLNVHTLAALCDIAFEGDVNPIITLGLGCDVDTENLDTFLNMVLNCSISNIGDINPVVAMNNIFVVVQVSNP